MCVSINGLGDHDLRPFDIETGMRVASKVRNIPSKCGHDSPLVFRIIRYVCDGRTDRQTDGRTDKSNAYCRLPYGGGDIIMETARKRELSYLCCCSFSKVWRQPAPGRVSTSSTG